LQSTWFCSCTSFVSSFWLRGRVSNGQSLGHFTTERTFGEKRGLGASSVVEASRQALFFANRLRQTAVSAVVVKVLLGLSVCLTHSLSMPPPPKPPTFFFLFPCKVQNRQRETHQMSGPLPSSFFFFF
ncbi:unnamed protein product, partial [Ixodes hexagonus]